MRRGGRGTRTTTRTSARSLDDNHRCSCLAASVTARTRPTATRKHSSIMTGAPWTFRRPLEPSSSSSLTHALPSRADYAEERRSELEVLESIFPDELESAPLPSVSSPCPSPPPHLVPLSALAQSSRTTSSPSRSSPKCRTIKTPVRPRRRRAPSSPRSTDPPSLPQTPSTSSSPTRRPTLTSRPSSTSTCSRARSPTRRRRRS